MVGVLEAAKMAKHKNLSEFNRDESECSTDLEPCSKL